MHKKPQIRCIYKQQNVRIPEYTYSHILASGGFWVHFQPIVVNWFWIYTKFAKIWYIICTHLKKLYIRWFFWSSATGVCTSVRKSSSWDPLKGSHDNFSFKNVNYIPNGNLYKNMFLKCELFHSNIPPYYKLHKKKVKI